MKPSDMPRKIRIEAKEPDYPPCPHPEKRAYPSKAKARKDDRLFTVPSWTPFDWDKARLYPYLCRCGMWHLTHHYRGIIPIGEEA